MRCRTIFFTLIALAGLAIIPVGDADADPGETHAVIWLYSESGTLVTTLVVTEGQDLRHALNGTMATTPHWRDVLTGYEYPMDKLVTHDLMLRASSEIPPQEPAPAPANHDLIYLAVGAVGLIVVIIAVGKMQGRRP